MRPRASQYGNSHKRDPHDATHCEMVKSHSPRAHIHLMIPWRQGLGDRCLRETLHHPDSRMSTKFRDRLAESLSVWEAVTRSISEIEICILLD